jgi:serine/threonine protein kinase
MNAKDNLSCDLPLLDEYIEARLDDETCERVESHLTNCAECRFRIEQSGFHVADWERTRSLLLPDSLDNLLLSVAESTEDLNANESSMLTREIRGWLDATDDPRMVGRFAGYEIVGIVGHGGMGIVLKGFESSLNRYVAIKILAPRLASNGSARKRFSREAQAAAAVRHDNVIAIHRVDEWHGLPFLVMPYAGGISLQKRIDSNGPLAIEQTLRVGVQVASGLAAAHAQGLIHRDIKPANILIEQGVERVTITDFGLARAADDASITRTGVIAGTPQYMSPEQAEARPLDARSDLFSLGSVLYIMATGRVPFRGEGSFEVLKRIVNEPARPMREIEQSVPEWFEHIVTKLHAKSPDDRPATASEVASLLEDCLAHVQQPTTTALPSQLTEFKTVVNQGSRRTIFKWMAAVVCSCLALLAGVLVVLEINKDPRITKSEAVDTTIHSTGLASGTDPFSKPRSPDSPTSTKQLFGSQVQVPQPTDSSVEWSLPSNLLGSIDSDLKSLESNLDDTGAVGALLQKDKEALSNGNVATRYSVHVWITGNGTGPKPGDLIDVNFGVKGIDSLDSEDVPVLHSVRVIESKDDLRESNHNRSVEIELELTQFEIARIRSYESQQSFTFPHTVPLH